MIRQHRNWRQLLRSVSAAVTALAVLVAAACGGPDVDDEAAGSSALGEATVPPAGGSVDEPGGAKRSDEAEQGTAWDYYGNPWSPTYLANNTLDRGTKISYRFAAKNSGSMRGFQNYFTSNTSRTGYASGNGGTIKIQLVPDNGNGLPNTSTVLAEMTWRPGLTNGLASPQGTSYTDSHPIWFAEKLWPQPPSLVAGQRYHIIFENIDASSSNWISLNNPYATRDTGRGPLAPSADDWGMTLDLGDGQGFGENTSRERFVSNGSRYEINLLLLMADGSSYGNAYMGATEDYAVAGDSGVRQVFTPRASIEVDRLAVFVAGLGRLRATLIRDGSEMASWAATTSDENWAHHLIPLVPFTLDEGVEYALEFSADEGSLVMGTFRDGSLGTGEVFGPGGTWSDGHAEYTNGGDWEPAFFTYADLTGVAFGRAG